jgi:hypothetical protein
MRHERRLVSGSTGLSEVEARTDDIRGVLALIVSWFALAEVCTALQLGMEELIGVQIFPPAAAPCSSDNFENLPVKHTGKETIKAGLKVSNFDLLTSVFCCKCSSRWSWSATRVLDELG